MPVGDVLLKLNVRRECLRVSLRQCDGGDHLEALIDDEAFGIEIRSRTGY